MADYKGISGTPWHVERFTRAEGDERRHRSRCKYYHKEDSYCSKEIGRCRGAAHCKFYQEVLQKDGKSNLQSDTPLSSPMPKTNQEPKENRKPFTQGFPIKQQTLPTQGKEKPLNTGFEKVNIEPQKTSRLDNNVSIATNTLQSAEVKSNPVDEPAFTIGTLVQDRNLGSGVVCEIKGKMIRVFYTRDGIAKWIDAYSCIRQKGPISQSESSDKTVSSSPNNSVAKKEDSSEETAIVKTGIKVQDRKLGLGVVRAVKGKMIQVYFERDGITKWIDSYFCIREKPSCVQTQSVEKPVSNKEGRKEPQLAARQEDSHPIKIGAKVMDNRLGVGTVREVNGSMIWVYFENYQITKLLDSRYCHFVDT